MTVTRTRINAAVAAIIATGFSFAFVMLTMPVSAIVALGATA